MNPNNNQRCGCPCRPQIPAPPCMNTDCGCSRCNTMPLPPSSCMPPQQPACNPAPPSIHLHVACQDNTPQPVPAGPGSTAQQIPSGSGAPQPIFSGSNTMSQQVSTGSGSVPQPTPTGVSSAAQQIPSNVGSASHQIPINSGNSMSGQPAFSQSRQPTSGHTHNQTATASVTSCGCGSGNPIVPDTDLGRMPIGMGYVPWQTWGQTYPMEQGFVRGTLFPDLDLPFLMGRCR